MSCCGKRKEPTGFGKVAPVPNPRQAQTQMRKAAEEKAAEERRAAEARRAQGGTQTFTLRTDDGRTQTFGTRLEADAARARLARAGLHGSVI